MDEGQSQVPQDCRAHMDGKVRGAAAQMSEMGASVGGGYALEVGFPQVGSPRPTPKFPPHPVLAGAVQAEAVSEGVCCPLLCLPY